RSATARRLPTRTSDAGPASCSRGRRSPSSGPRPVPVPPTRRYAVAETFEPARPLLAEHADIERQLSGPAVHGDPAALRRLNKRYAALGPTVAAYRSWERAVGDLGAAREMAAEEPSFAEELPALEEAATRAAEHLRRQLVPRDPDDDRD